MGRFSRSASSMIYQTIVALTLAASASAALLYTDDHVKQKALFEEFKVAHGKKYSTMEEETRRFYIFVDNLKVADQRNAEEKKTGGSAVHGVTKFSDLSQVEFETNFLTSDPTLKSSKPRKIMADLPPPKTNAGLVDWSDKYNSAVKDQGYCGSCWAFSATEQIESDVKRTLGKTFVLSPEQITQCDQTSSGCSGGWTERAYEYVNRAGGLETDEDYPYTSYQGVTGTCKSTKSKFVVTVNDYTTINGEANMASYVQSTGPLSVCLDAARWNSYRGGIVSSCGNRVDHCVQAVGVDAASVGGYWLVRNSWGTSWGEDGFIRLQYGEDMCAITEDPTWADVSLV